MPSASTEKSSHRSSPPSPTPRVSARTRVVRRRFFQVLAIYAVLHVYMWWRLVWPLPSPAWQIATAIVVVLAPMFPLTMRFARRLPRENAKPYLLVGYGWFAPSRRISCLAPPRSTLPPRSVHRKPSPPTSVSPVRSQS